MEILDKNENDNTSMQSIYLKVLYAKKITHLIK